MLNIDRSFIAEDKSNRNGQEWYGIIIHHTGIGSRKDFESEERWREFYKNMRHWLTTRDGVNVSCHYIIGRYGEVSEIVNPDTHIAYHAGHGKYYCPKRREITGNCNYNFIGIELVGDGNKLKYTPEQYQTLSELTVQLLAKFPTIKINMIQGHEVVDPENKVDPGRYFEWDNYLKDIMIQYMGFHLYSFSKLFS